MANPKDRCIVAVDVPDIAAARALMHICQPYFGFYKIGLQLYLREGARVVELFKDAGHKVFLDLKLHDIPATVGKAAASVASLEPDLLTVHASGGRDMIRAARQNLADHSKVLAVTVLTSHSEEDARRLWQSDPQSLAVRWLNEASEGGADGWVSSVWELAALRPAMPNGLAVTPGIRLPNADTQDQQRVASPRRAFDEGADYLVIGRAVTQASDIDQAVADIERNIAGTSQE